MPLCYTSDITTHILKVIGIPKFDTENPIHTRLAALSQQAHALAKDPKGLQDPSGLLNIEAQVDEAAAELWGITDRELKEIRRSLAELG